MNSNLTDMRYSTARGIAYVAGIFSLLVCALLLYDFSRRQLKDPFEDNTLKALKTSLTIQPDNSELRQQIRALDLEVRGEYFRQRAFATVGAGLLLGSLGVCLIAARYAAALRRKLPSPTPQAAPREVDIVSHLAARWAVGVLGLVLIGAAVGMTLSSRSTLPRTEAEIADLMRAKQPAQAAKTIAPAPRQEIPPSEMPKPEPKEKSKLQEVSRSETEINPSKQSATEKKPTAEVPAIKPLPTPPSPVTEEQIAAMWPRFRGRDGSGVSAFDNIPTKWNASTGENILWKAPVPLPGNSSPIVCGERIFLTGATEVRRAVFCFDARNGALLWEKEAPGTPESTAKPPKVNGETGYASPTAVTDGRRVFAIFANGDIAGFEFDGAVAWARSLGMPVNSYGHASSLIMYKNLVLVQFDQGTDKQPKSKLLALDAESGKTVWEVAREVPNSWSTPIVIQAASRDQLITTADPWVISYNPADAHEEFWRAKCLRSDVGPSPTHCDGAVYVANMSPNVSAIRADGKGDVTKTHVLWTGEDNLPDTCSPLATSQYVFTLMTEGTLTCYDAHKGDNLWEHDFPGFVFTSSPSLVGRYVYLIGYRGNERKGFVVEPGQKDCTVIAENDMGEICFASPAFQDGRMYVRGENSLFCIGEKK
jgi:outer membrane protein assembly factor BamB